MSLDRSLLEDAIQYAERWIEYKQNTYWVPAVAVAIRHGDELLLDRPFGVASVERDELLTTGHVFHLASQAKMVTAVAVLQLVEQQRLRLDDRIAQHLHWAPSGEDEVGQITVRELLQHAGGLMREGTVGPLWQLTDPLPDIDAIRTSLMNDAPIFERNRYFKYSNLGYAVLGLIIEVASGKPYGDYVTDHIFTSLGMTSATADLDVEHPEQRVTGYSGTANGLERRPLPDTATNAFAPAAGLSCTAADMSRFTQALFFGDHSLITDAMKREAFHGSWIPIYNREPYGLGFVTQPSGVRPSLVGHDGMFPGQISTTVIDPDRKLSVVVLTNTIDGPANELAYGIMELLSLALDQAVPSPQEAAELDRFTGRFYNLYGAEDLVRLGNQLFSFSPEDYSPAQNPTRLTRIDDDSLEITWADGYGGLGERMTFTWDEHGNVDCMHSGNDPQYPFEKYLNYLNDLPLPSDDAVRGSHTESDGD